MTYTNEEVKKMHAHIEKIIEYLTENAVKLGKHFDINFDPANRYKIAMYNYGGEPTFSGWKGNNYEIPFRKPITDSDKTIFDSYEGIQDFCFSVIKNWQTIKMIIHTELARQEEVRQTINNFKI